jgi:hypothetical protein
MAIYDDAHLVLILADYIGIDAAGKINALGAGFAMAGFQANGLTAPQHLAALIDVPGKYHGSQFAFSLELRDEDTGQPVQVPDPTGVLGALRVQNVITVTRSGRPDLYVPETMFARSQVSLGFPDGLPVQPGKMYGWHAQIDGKSRDHWVARFYVPGPPPPPVVGGPSGPASIPGLFPSGG